MSTRKERELSKWEGYIGQTVEIKTEHVKDAFQASGAASFWKTERGTVVHAYYNKVSKEVVLLVSTGNDSPPVRYHTKTASRWRKSHLYYGGIRVA